MYNTKYKPKYHIKHKKEAKISYKMLIIIPNFMHNTKHKPKYQVPSHFTFSQI